MRLSEMQHATPAERRDGMVMRKFAHRDRTGSGPFVVDNPGAGPGTRQTENIPEAPKSPWGDEAVQSHREAGAPR